MCQQMCAAGGEIHLVEAEKKFMHLIEPKQSKIKPKNNQTETETKLGTDQLMLVFSFCWSVFGKLIKAELNDVKIIFAVMF